jgi:F-type H+-transporting ATPase subunit b
MVIGARGSAAMRHYWLLAGFAVLAFALFGGGLSVADEHAPTAAQTPVKGEAAGHGGKTESGGHGNDDGGIFSGLLDLAIWTVVVFLLLFFVLRGAAWKPMLAGLQKREQLIHGAMHEAQLAKEEAQKLREQLQREMNQASEKVRQTMEEARRSAQQMSDEMVNKARSEIQAERERHRREISIAKDQALQEIWTQTAQLATLVSAKAIRRQLTPDDQRRLVEEAMADMRNAGDGLRREVGL